MIEKIQWLKKISASLEPDASIRKLTREKVIDYTENFINTFNSAAAFYFNDNNKWWTSKFTDLWRSYRYGFMWDGAYSAFFTLCEQRKKFLKDMKKPDSMVMAPHKGTFIPYWLGALTEEIQKNGKIFFSCTKINGNFSLRLATLSSRTHLDTIDLAIQIIQPKSTVLIRKE